MTVLNEKEQHALLEAFDDEYRSWTTYDRVVHDLGPERPFINIREAEARHIEVLCALLRRYGVHFPANRWSGRVPRFSSIREACEVAIDAEVANAALCERLMLSTARQEILAVFDELRRASQDRHLPAFRRCANRGRAWRAGRI